MLCGAIMNSFCDIEFIKKIGLDFHGAYSEQVNIANKFEHQANYPMAYLAYWMVVEEFAKSLAPLCKRAELKKALQQWTSYLLGEVKVQPKAISTGKFELENRKSEKIPSEALLFNALNKDTTPSIFALLHTGGRYRKRRNRIAHFAENVNEEVYREFKTLILKAIEEIEKWLTTQQLEHLNEIRFI